MDDDDPQKAGENVAQQIGAASRDHSQPNRPGAADVPWSRLRRQLKRSARAVIPPAPEPGRDHAQYDLPPSPLQVASLG